MSDFEGPEQWGTKRCTTCGYFPPCQCPGNPFGTGTGLDPETFPTPDTYVGPALDGYAKAEPGQWWCGVCKTGHDSGQACPDSGQTVTLAPVLEWSGSHPLHDDHCACTVRPRTPSTATVFGPRETQSWLETFHAIATFGLVCTWPDSLSVPGIREATRELGIRAGYQVTWLQDDPGWKLIVAVAQQNQESAR